VNEAKLLSAVVERDCPRSPYFMKFINPERTGCSTTVFAPEARASPSPSTELSPIFAPIDSATEIG